MQQAINTAQKEITDLKMAVRTSENKLRSFFESSSVIHLLIDTKLCLIDFNRAAVSFVKKYYNIDIHAGIKITSFMHPDHLVNFLHNYQKALNGIPVRVERELQYGEEIISWFINYEPAWDGDKNILGMSFNAVDVTEKIANENKIVSQYHSLKEIAFIQSHNLRRPVTNIMGLMDLFEVNGYRTSKEGLIMLKKAVTELEAEMKKIEQYAS